MSAEYLHSISCRHLLPSYVVSSSRCPLVFRLYPMALMMSGLWCCGRLFFGRSRFGIMVVVNVANVALPSWSPSCVESRDFRVRSCCSVPAFVSVYVLKSMMGCLPRSMLMINHRPPL
jgi:hypothetical protein